MADSLLLPMAAVVAFVTAHAGTAYLSRRRPDMLLDHPNERSSHERPTPRGGGLMIVLVVLLGGTLYASLSGAWEPIAPFLAAGLLIAAVSLLDDLRSLPTALRLGVHVVAATFVLWCYTDWRGVSLAPLPAALSAVVTLLWIVGLVNAYNFMDGIDGLAASQAVIAGLAWVMLGLLLGSTPVVWLATLVTAGSAGFLLHNRPPARIFMGDVGSAFLGYTFAVLPLMFGTSRVGLAAVCIVGLFVFDSMFTFVRRLARRENVFRAHRSHLYQRLVGAGASHGRVTALYTLLAAGFASAGLAVSVGVRHWLTAALLLTVAPSVGLWLHVRSEEKQRETAGAESSTHVMEKP